ncbi:hypothetical protein [Halostagnicola kamekurae]|uniref:Uncharacterized protein n=1 Tax=Halostagnicola kamekurae TaxID=619731 RepID=A0A1I6S2E6_9EURY|nr:hypothetical protein [Halostagnicola kamekurae]SFS71094.1 hypothetical protein SAMN04488556_2383 [Halostagnicola kamekurae]
MIASTTVTLSPGATATTQRAGTLERHLGRGLETSRRTVERTVSGGARDGC